MGLPAELANRLTDRQAVFIGAFAKGHNATESAKLAGYAFNSCNVEGSRLLALPHVLAAIAFETRRLLVSGAPAALRVIQEIAANAELNPKVRLDAAKTLLDRAGHVAPRASEPANAGDLPLHEMALADLRALAGHLEAEIAIRARDVSSASHAPNSGQAVDLLG